MAKPLQELLHQIRIDLVRDGEHENADAVLSLLAATAAVDELTAAIHRNDSDAITFHAEMLQEVLIDVRPLDFRIIGG
jgi:hypothetical protein